jgi:hypothetical protein
MRVRTLLSFKRPREKRDPAAARGVKISFPVVIRRELTRRSGSDEMPSVKMRAMMEAVGLRE